MARTQLTTALKAGYMLLHHRIGYRIHPTGSLVLVAVLLLIFRLHHVVRVKPAALLVCPVVCAEDLSMVGAAVVAELVVASRTFMNRVNPRVSQEFS